MKRPSNRTPRDPDRSPEARGVTDERELVRLGSCGGHHVHLATRALITSELDMTVDHREQSVVLAEPDVASREEARPTLAHENVSGAHALASETLDAQALRVRLAIVP